MNGLEGIAPAVQMWGTLAIVVGALVLYATERLPIEVTSVGVVCTLLVLFHIVPRPGPSGENLLDAARLLQGFANPALVAVLALMVIGQGIVRTGILERSAQWAMDHAGGMTLLLLPTLMLAVAVLSAFLNNTPLVVIFIPIMQAVARRLNISPSKVMMPLSFAALLGGMTTLIGSSTNLLVNSALTELGQRPFRFFDFSIPGMVIAAAGLVYVALVAPRLLRARATLADTLLRGGSGGRHFIAQITIGAGSKLVGVEPKAGLFPELREVTVRLIQRDEEAILPPFERYRVQAGDIFVVAATRKALTDALAADQDLLTPDPKDLEEGDLDTYGLLQRRERTLAEVMVAPASRMIGQTLPQIGFRRATGCVVLGIQRRSRMMRGRMADIRLEAGDELLIQGTKPAIAALRSERDLVLIAASAEDLPEVEHAGRAMLIFAGVVLVAASGLLPIVITALVGAAAMVATGVLNVRQAARSIDPAVVAAVGAALAMSVALQETGGASFVAHRIIAALDGYGTITVLSVFFLLIGILTNVISNNACAVLFTPIGVGLAQELGVSVEMFAMAVVFGANCSFATPIGYQTNLLVMGPGHYRFTDFTVAGLPLVFVLWGAFTLFAPWYFGL